MRAFIAIEVPDEVASGITSVSKELAAKGTTLVKKESIHITTHFFADIAEADINQVSDAMAKAPLHEFRAEACGISHFNYRLMFVEITEGRSDMESLYKALSERIFVDFDKTKDFVPHITIARVRASQGTQRLTSFIGKYENHSFGRFPVSKISLKQSTLWDSEPLYTTLFERKF